MKLITLFLLVVASFGAFAQTMDGGYNHTLIICTDSTVYASGANKYGELGNGTQVSANTFIPVSGITGALEVASGSNHNLVLDIEGNVWVWGRNNFGQLGLGNYTDYTTPQKLSGVSNVLHIYAGDYHSYVVCKDGNVYAWGKNNVGQLATGDIENRNTPFLIPELYGIKKLSVGQGHVYALTYDKKVWVWGQNNYGQLGLGHTKKMEGALLNTALSNIKDISSGNYFGVAVNDVGALFTWGDNSFGALGHGASSKYYVPTKINGLADNFVAVASGYSHSIALDANNNVFMWGFNYQGQLGNGTTQDVNVPTVSSIVNVSRVSVGSYSTMIYTNDNKLMVFGANQAGQLGNGNTSNLNVPAEITLPCELGNQISNCASAATIITSKVNACQGESIDISTESTESAYQWFIDGAGVSSNQNFSFTFNSAGTRNIELQLNPQGCNNGTTISFVVNNLPDASFDAPAQACINGGLVTLEPTIANGTFSGTAISGVQFNPLEAGMGTTSALYTITENGCTASITKNIEVIDVPIASFTALQNGDSIYLNNTTTSATTYSWVLGDGNSSEEMNIAYVYTATGNYTVILYAINSCGTNSSQQEISFINTGIKNLLSQEFDVYPSPSNGTFEVRFGIAVLESEAKQLKITDAKGSEIFVQELDSKQNSVKVDLSASIQPGNYLVSIQTSKQIYTHPIVIK